MPRACWLVPTALGCHLFCSESPWAWPPTLHKALPTEQAMGDCRAGLTDPTAPHSYHPLSIEVCQMGVGPA